MCKLPDTVKNALDYGDVAPSGASVKMLLQQMLYSPVSNLPQCLLALTTAQAPHMCSQTVRHICCRRKQNRSSIATHRYVTRFLCSLGEAKGILHTVPASLMSRNHFRCKKLRILKGILQESEALNTWEGIPVTGTLASGDFVWFTE